MKKPKLPELQLLDEDAATPGGKFGPKPKKQVKPISDVLVQLDLSKDQLDDLMVFVTRWELKQIRSLEQLSEAYTKLLALTMLLGPLAEAYLKTFDLARKIVNDYARVFSEYINMEMPQELKAEFDKNMQTIIGEVVGLVRVKLGDAEADDISIKFTGKPYADQAPRDK